MYQIVSYIIINYRYLNAHIWELVYGSATFLNSALISKLRPREFMWRQRNKNIDLFKAIMLAIKKFQNYYVNE
jgi:hypothetical protein